jgi:hypothetical protein
MKKKTYISISVVAIILLIQFVPLLSRSTVFMRKYTNNTTTYFYENINDYEAISKTFKDRRKEVENELSIKNAKKLRIYIYKNVFEFHEKCMGGILGLLMPEWAIGTNTKDSILITSPLNPGNANTYDSIISSCVHEYIHVLTDAINPHLSIWLKEGIATYFAGQKPNGIQKMRYKYGDFTIRNSTRFGNIGGYQASYSFVEYLINKYGKDKLLQLIINSENYSDVYGKLGITIFDEWKQA